MAGKTQGNSLYLKQDAKRAIVALRILSAQSVFSAGSGHLGAPLGLAPAMYALWAHEIRFDPTHPKWPGRDRFILSGGHASALYYALMHLAAFKDRSGQNSLPRKELENLRKLGSLTPAHPEYGHTVGVEMTTGPLGQGCATSVGMAAGAKWLNAVYSGKDLFNQRIFTFCGDGDFMEGVSSEAASLAGHWGLGNLVWIYDNNEVSIEGKTSLAFGENVPERFKAYGWNVETIENGEDWEAILQALTKTRFSKKPTLINLHTLIGRGLLDRQGTEKAHGGILKKEELETLYAQNDWDEEIFLAAPEEVFLHFQDTLGRRGAEAHQNWQNSFDVFRDQFPQKAIDLENIFSGNLPEHWINAFDALEKREAPCSTRISSGKMLFALADYFPWLLGGAGDVGPSTFTLLPREKDFGNPENSSFSYGGRNIHFGVREGAMGAISSGLALMGLRPFAGTFLAFFDYIHPAVRLAAMMKLPVIYIFTLDSIKVGEDGPTHQPVEQLAQLRAIPNLTVIRPADENETLQAWKVAALTKNSPVALVFSRQSVLQLTDKNQENFPLSKGAYVLKDFCKQDELPQCILMASGSELALVVSVAERLFASGISVRVVSFPSFELFEQQTPIYKEKIFPKTVRARIAVELGVSQGWEKYTGLDGAILSVENFGESGDGEALAQNRGFTEENLFNLAQKVLLRS
ncbi:transketolase [Acetobacteraceae bacterium]|nr:transketolase [Acetobacteraceae bacterium]